MSPLTESVSPTKSGKSSSMSDTRCLQHREMHCSEQLPANDPLRVEAVELTQDIARHVLRMASKRLSTSGSQHHATTMRRVVDDVMTRHSILFNGMVKRLSLSDVEDAVTSFQTVVAEMCKDGVNNWGRLVTVFAFAGRLAKRCVELDIVSADRPETVDHVSTLLGQQIADGLGCWIRDNGGWDQFETFFTPQTAESSLWRGLLTAALGLGAVAAVIAVR